MKNRCVCNAIDDDPEREIEGEREGSKIGRDDRLRAFGVYDGLFCDELMIPQNRCHTGVTNTNIMAREKFGVYNKSCCLRNIHLIIYAFVVNVYHVRVTLKLN